MALFAITGMHRSGTSAVAGLVERLGADLGPEHLRLGASRENPRGYFEHVPLVRLDDDLLSYLGGSWDDPPPLGTGWQRAAALEAFRRRGAEILSLAFPDQDLPCVVKDPRLSILMPFWRSVASFAGTIHVLRDPLEVAASLARRGLSEEHATRLWMQYTCAAVVDDPAALVVSYDRVIDDQKAVVDEIADFIGCEVGNGDSAASAVDAQLRHHRFGSTDTNEITLPASELYRALLETTRVEDRMAMVESGIDDVLPPGVDAYPHRIDLATAQARALRAEDEAAIGRDAERIIQELQRQLDEAERDAALVSDAARSATQLEDARARLDVELERSTALQRESDRQRSQIALLNRSVAALLRAEARSRNDAAMAVRTSADLEAATVEVAALKAENVALRRAVEVAEEQAHRMSHDFERLRSRRSVRLTLRAARSARPLFRTVRILRRRNVQSATMPSNVGPAAPKEASVVLTAAHSSTAIDRLLCAPAVTVVVPVYGAAADVERCLASLVAHTHADVRILVIDDASPGDDIAVLLESWRSDPGIEVVRNEQNLGFVATVNRGLELAGRSDVVILNSDTEVTPGWLPRLRLAAYSAADIGTATPLSDNAGAFSAPEPGTNTYPEHPLDSVAREIARHSRRVLPETPTGNGYCMFVKRALVDDIGGFDIEHFPRGYGEENDFCMRGVEAGWRHVVDDSTLVRHALGRSFGSERDALMVEGRAMLDELHPSYTERVRDFLSSEPIALARASVGAALAAIESDPTPRRPRILYSLHGAGGGTPLTNRDLMAGVATAFEPFLLLSNGQSLVMQRMDDSGAIVDVERHDLSRPVVAGEWTHRQYRELVSEFIVRHDIEIVHVRQWIHHTLDLVDVCRALDRPLVVSLHDYFVVCPTTQLLDDKMRFCGGKCTAGQGTCFVDFDWLTGLPHLKHSYVHEWRRQYADALQSADALVTTSPSARAVILGALPSAAAMDFRIIEHGRDLEQRHLAVAPSPGGPIRIVVPGNINEQKGGEVVKRLRELDTERRLQFVVMGNVKKTLGDLGTTLGPYDREDFADLIEQIGPAFAGIFSIWAETYSHTLSESWAAGLPVLAFDLGAVGERVREHGGGWLLDLEDPEGIYRAILAIADDPEEYERGRATARAENLRTVEAMAADYLSLYDDVRARRRRTAVVRSAR